jgi:MYXO-CTERM domain-containing protein
MKVKSVAMVAGVGASLLLAGQARADYLGITWEKDPFALNGATLLADLPGYGGQSVYNIYAEFSQATDQAVGVVGTPTNPFSVFVQGQDGAFVNTPPGMGGADTPPSVFLSTIQPSLNWDSFYTIGSKFSDPFGTPGNDALVVAPGTPGPNGPGKWGAGAIGMNMAWTLPPTNGQGLPQPLTVAGASGRVLLMRISVANQAKIVEGSFGVLTFSDGVGSESPGSFKTVEVPAPGAMALLGLAGLAGFSRRRRS